MFRYIIVSGLLTIWASMAHAVVTLEPSLPSGQLVGTTITWTATDPDARDFRFSVEDPSGSVMIVRDFDTYNTFEWVPLVEGLYSLGVTARDALSGEARETTVSFEMMSRVRGQRAVVSRTNHPLVALYSMPKCQKPQQIRVQYRVEGDAVWMATPWQPCVKGASVNRLVAGMRAETTYELRHQRMLGSTNDKDATEAETKDSAILRFTTGAVESEVVVRPFNVIAGPAPDVSAGDNVILHSQLFNFVNNMQTIACPIATDLMRNVVWYYKVPCIGEYLGSIINSLPGPRETFLLHMSKPAPLPFAVRGQMLREIDLAGNTVRETNVERINEQLEGMGEEPIYYLHHDTRRLDNGHTLVLAGVERITVGVQEPLDELIDIVGDMVLDLDENWQVVWVWNSLNHPDMLPLSRQALRDEECGETARFNVCGPLRNLALTDRAHDWTHGNAVTYTAEDGNFLVSFRHQDWVIKVRYEDGQGDGKVLWRLGREGEFALKAKQSGLPEDEIWFSGQHQPLVYHGDKKLVIYDNANALNEPFDPNNIRSSRGQTYLLDEEGGIATQLINADLGVFSPFVGSAQLLSNGNYHFLSGGAYSPNCGPVLGIPGCFSQSTEIDLDGNILYILEAPESVTYRSFRMRGMYELAVPLGK
jgi:hypothetical protein